MLHQLSSETATQVRQSMAALGVHLRQDWIKHCLQAGGDANPGDNGGSPRQQSDAQEEVYRAFLASDLREAGEACLPPGVGSMVKERVKGKIVVQVESARDIAKNFEQREKTDGASAHHTLKLALGDGRQTVAAFEYRPVEGLAADPPLGLKILLVEPWVRRGILLLASENTTVLGGEVSSLVEARDAARASREQNTAGAARSTNTRAAEPSQIERNQNQSGRPPAAAAGSGTASQSVGANNGGSRAPLPRNAIRTQEDSSRPHPPPPGGSRPRHDENADPGDPGAVVDLSSSSLRGNSGASSSSSQGRRNDDEGSAAGRGGRGRLSEGSVASSRPNGSSGSGSSVFNPYSGATQAGPSPGAAVGAAAASRGGVANPYSASTQPASKPGVATIGTARIESQQGLGGVARSGSSSSSWGLKRGEEPRVPAFRDLDDDDGPGFEYFEEPDFDDDDGAPSSGGGQAEQEPPDDVVGHNLVREGPERRSNLALGFPSAGSTPFPPPETSAGAKRSSPSPLVTPRPKIVSARVQQEKLREAEEEESRKRRKSRDEDGDHGNCGVGDVGGEVAGIEGESVNGLKGGVRSRSRSRERLDPSRSRRSRSSSQLGGLGGELVRGKGPISSPPSSGPFTPLQDLDRLAAAGGGVYRVKAVVSDTKSCKIRKKQYLLVVEVEDGTAVVSVRLSEQITRRLFGVEAREFKKIFQANPDHALSIQTRVEKEIREMEGVMEIDTSAAGTGSQQSPANAGVALSQTSASGDSEWLLPVVLSVTPPTDADCYELLSRVTSMLP